MSAPGNGSFVWYELLTTDPIASVEFYEHVLGWASQRLDGLHGHVMYSTGQGPMASATLLPEQAKQMGAPPFWTANVRVANTAETCSQVSALGGRVYHEPLHVSGIGSVAVIADPFGAVLNVFAPDKPSKMHDLSLPGEVCWHELLSDDPEAALAFYAQIFGWKKSRDFDMGPIGTYVLFNSGGPDIGGLFKRPSHIPVSAWVYYVQVDNVDLAVARATSKGATLCNGPMTVPGGARIAQLSDPQGAAFAVHENPKV